MATGTWQIITDLEQAKELHAADLLWVRATHHCEWLRLELCSLAPNPTDKGRFEFAIRMED